MTEQELCDEYRAWLKTNELPEEAAEELLARHNASDRRHLTEEQYAWLMVFIIRWEDMLIDQEARRAVEAA